MTSKNILFNLSLVIPEKRFNDQEFNEYIQIAFRLLDVKESLKEYTEKIKVENHRATVPKHVSISQIVLTENECMYPMYLSTSPFFNVECEPSPTCNCTFEYHMYNGIIQTNFKEGEITMAYMDYTSDIPDDEVIKEAIFYYCMYRYYMKLSLLNEPNAYQMMNDYMSKWSLYRLKAKGRQPSIPELENIANMNSLVPKSNQYELLFSSLNRKEYVKYA